jgi:hypothetical protein
MRTPQKMPPEGTEAQCEFCREVVMLVPVPSQGWHWLHDGDPVDGQRHCLGGIRYEPTLRTLHKPRDLAWMYDETGYPLGPTGQRLPGRRC